MEETNEGQSQIPVPVPDTRYVTTLRWPLAWRRATAPQHGEEPTEASGQDVSRELPSGGI